MPTTTPIEDVWADKGNLPYNAIVATADGKYPALDGSLITNIAGSGDMSASVYDPNTVAADAFAMDNMAEGSTTKILTATERSEIAANTLKTGITTAQADEIAANTLKVTYPSADSSKLAGIATGAEVNTIDSAVAGEPSGSDLVLNVVSLTQAEYDAGTKIGTTLYIIS